MDDKTKHKLDLHLKDYEAVRKDVDEIQSWWSWGLRIVLGAVLVAILMLVGLK